MMKTAQTRTMKMQKKKKKTQTREEREIKSKSNRTLKYDEWKDTIAFYAVPGHSGNDYHRQNNNNNNSGNNKPKLIFAREHETNNCIKYTTTSHRTHTHTFGPNENFFCHSSTMVRRSPPSPISQMRQRAIVNFSPSRCCIIKLRRSLVSRHALAFGSCDSIDQKRGKEKC